MRSLLKVGAFFLQQFDSLTWLATSFCRIFLSEKQNKRMGGIKFRRVFFFKSHYNEENDKPDHELKKKLKKMMMMMIMMKWEVLASMQQQFLMINKSARWWVFDFLQILTSVFLCCFSWLYLCIFINYSTCHRVTGRANCPQVEL